MGRQSPLGIEGTGLSFRDPDERGRPRTAQVRARDENGAWECRRFAVASWRRDGTPIVPDEAKTWARQTRKSFVKGESVARAATFQEFASVLCENLEAAGVGSDRLDLIRAVSKGLAQAGISDMRYDTFAPRVRTWITGLRRGWSLPPDAKNRPKTSGLLSSATRNKILVVCRQVTGLAIARRRLAFDPLAELPHFKEELRIKPVFTIAELRHMVSDEARDHAIIERAKLECEIEATGLPRLQAVRRVAEQRGLHWTSIYHRLRRKPAPDPWWLACCLLVYTGARAQEAMHLRWEWVKWDASVITLKLADDYDQKTDSERLIPLEPELRDILHPIAKPGGHILPPEIRAGGSGMRTFEDSVATGEGSRDYSASLRRYLARIGLDCGDRTAHSIRHTYISGKIARHDMNVDRLRKAVGHENATTTAGYSRLSQLFEAEVDRWPNSSLWLRRSFASRAAREPSHAVAQKVHFQLDA